MAVWVIARSRGAFIRWLRMEMARLYETQGIDKICVVSMGEPEQNLAFFREGADLVYDIREKNPYFLLREWRRTQQRVLMIWLSSANGPVSCVQGNRYFETLRSDFACPSSILRKSWTMIYESREFNDIPVTPYFIDRLILLSGKADLSKFGFRNLRRLNGTAVRRMNVALQKAISTSPRSDHWVGHPTTQNRRCPWTFRGSELYKPTHFNVWHAHIEEATGLLPPLARIVFQLVGCSF